MTRDGLTSDNVPLSRPSADDDDDVSERDVSFAINCKIPGPVVPRAKRNTGPGAQIATPMNSPKLRSKVAEFVRSSRAPNTHAAYTSDLAQFQAWGGTLPASPELVAAYLAAHAEVHAVATLRRRLAAISNAHKARGLPNPAAAELVKATLRGIARTRAVLPRAAKPLLRDDLFTVLDAIGTMTADHRDRALLLIGFAGGLRRSELAGLDVADIAQVPQGLVFTLRHSKTDRLNAGQKIGIPFGGNRHCPVRAMKEWLEVSGITSGAVFRSINRHGTISGKRLSPEAVSQIVKRRLTLADREPIGYSGHSLRAGFATSAAIAGEPLWKIQMQTRHATVQAVAHYVRAGTLFDQSGAAVLF